jgi:hypothetical protein
VAGSTLFAYSFGGSEDIVDNFQSMFDSARLAAGTQQLALYGHNVVESAERGSLVRKRVLPHRRATADVVLQLEEAKDSQFSPEHMGDFLTPRDVCDEGALLLPAWRVRMTAGTTVSRECDFIFVF